MPLGIILSVFFGFIPMVLYAGFIYSLDHYEKEPRHLLQGAFVWGAVAAAGAAFFLNTFLGAGIYMLSGDENFATLTTGSIIAPLVEEILKGMAVMIVFLFFRQEFDSVLDGIVYAAVTALGFAATENAYYIFTYGYLESGYIGLFSLVFVRVILVGWQHPFYTAFFGIGLAMARLKPGLKSKLFYPLAGMFFAMLLHSLHNTIPAILPGAAGILIGTVIDWSGWIAMLTFTIAMVIRERRLLERYLMDEVRAGLLTHDQFRTACSGWSRFLAVASALGNHRFEHTRQFFQTCAELAHKKHQLDTVGNERGNRQIIESLRVRLAELSLQLN